MARRPQSAILESIHFVPRTAQASTHVWRRTAASNARSRVHDSLVGDRALMRSARADAFAAGGAGLRALARADAPRPVRRPPLGVGGMLPASLHARRWRAETGAFLPAPSSRRSSAFVGGFRRPMMDLGRPRESTEGAASSKDGVFRGPDGRPDGPDLLIFLEFMPCGSMSSVLKKFGA